MAQFGLRYFAQLRSKYKGVFWRVEIAERDYSATASRWSSPAARPSPSRGRTDEFYVPVKTSKGMSESLLPLLQANVVIYHLYIRIRLEFILCRYRLI